MLLKIPLEIVELDKNSYHIFVEGYINSQRCHLIIDTGASKTVFALNHLQNILIDNPIAEPEIQSAGISALPLDSHSGVISEFKLGKLLLPDMNVILIDLSSIDELYLKVSDKVIWGLIGSDFLLQYKAILDYGAQMLTLKVPKSSILKI